MQLRSVVGLLGGLALGFLAQPSSACMNEVVKKLAPVEDIATAEREVDAGKLGEATHRIRLRYPKIRELDASAPPLAQRALRIYALALVRANGQLDSSAGWARTGNLEWAIATLAELDAVRTNDAKSQADLAEARLRFTRTQAEGMRVLEDLDRRDLLGSAWAYKALARARRAKGDDGGASAALRRCAVMSTDQLHCIDDFT